jgi:hypothetical protein
MKFSIGDRVLLKHTGDEGTVVSYITEQLMEVEVGGTTFPVYADELEHPYLKWFTQQATKQKKPGAALPEIPVEKLKTRVQRLATGVYLSFFPQFAKQSAEDVVESLKVYLLNEMPVSVGFSYKVKLQQGVHFSLDGILHPFSNIYLHQIAFELMNDSPKFIWTLADAANDKLRKEEGVTKIRPDKLFAHINKLLLDNEPSFEYKLLDEFMPAPPKQKPQPVRVQARVRVMQDLAQVKSMPMMPDFDPHYVIDLHIEKLMPEIKGLSNSMIMDIQLGALTRSIHSAVINHQEMLIIIHGVGTGALKDAVHQLLASTPEVLRYSNEWLGKYGYGATEVVFKR